MQSLVGIDETHISEHISMLLNFVQREKIILGCIVDLLEQSSNLLSNMHTIQWIVGFLESTVREQIGDDFIGLLLIILLSSEFHLCCRPSRGILSFARSTIVCPFRSILCWRHPPARPLDAKAIIV